jgi:hypothetical protein
MSGRVLYSTIKDGLSLYLDAANPSSYISGNKWYDVSRNNIDLNLVNGLSFDPSNKGCFIFDGINDYAGINTSLNTGQDFSVFAWIKPGAINIRNAIIGNSYSFSSQMGWLFTTATNYAGAIDTFLITIGNDDAYIVAANNSLVLDSWNYVGASVSNSGQDIKLYANGMETLYQGSLLNNNTILYDVNEFSIGRRYSGTPEYFIGSISIIQIYNRVLNPHEINQNFNTLKGRYGY